MSEERKQEREKYAALCAAKAKQYREFARFAFSAFSKDFFMTSARMANELAREIPNAD